MNGRYYNGEESEPSRPAQKRGKRTGFGEENVPGSILNLRQAFASSRPKITTDNREWAQDKGMIMRNTRAGVLPPGEFIREELEARGWSQSGFAKILGRPLQAVNEIINGRKRITAETAKEIAAAFGTSPELWLNLENAYRLAQTAEPDPAIKKRAAATP